MNLTEQGLQVLAASPIADHPHAHAHFWERALSRRHFLTAAGLAGGAAVTSSVWMPQVARASGSVAPTPIPYGTTITGPSGPVLFHFNGPAANTDVSSIFNFKGMVGVADIEGPGAGVHNGQALDGPHFGSDNRFMKGVYVGADGRRHHGTFAFI
ncbi:MAG TPA: twin-arginine translocation signal domain-containing protein [Candidatus Dormibacteraeota bacterium]|nr:twin-arginine translocation signal domain-containing protein [Candidatus Dormibacteraeota bacterium]